MNAGLGEEVEKLVVKNRKMDVNGEWKDVLLTTLVAFFLRDF